MTMVKNDRSADRDWDDDDRDGRRERLGRAPAPGSLPIRLAEAAMRNPVTTGGVAISVLMIAVTVANAVANQPLRHPHPIFDTRSTPRIESRPSPVDATGATPTTHSVPSAVPTVLPRPKPIGAFDDGLVRDLQTALADRGFYTGPIDGVIGPATAEAIRACERRLGTTPTGEPSELLLAALRAAPDLSAAPVQPAVQPAPRPAPTRATTQGRQAAVVPAPPTPPTPSMRVAAAEAVAYPATEAEAANPAEVATPVFTGSIRRAAREPLAPGGDEKLQKLQRALISVGYGPIKADGRWNELSISAVRRYEADRGWPVTGRPSDRLVWDLMAKAAQPRR